MASYEYENGRLTKETDFNGNVKTYNYDLKGRKTGETVTGTYGLTIYAYDALNRITSIKTPDGGTTNYTYDANNNVLSVSRPERRQNNLYL